MALPFSTWIMSSHCPFASLVSDEKLTVKLIDDSLYVISHFSLAAFKMISLSFDNFIIMCLGVDLFTFILLGFV